MLVIGERLNSTRSSIREAISQRNAAHILNEVKLQMDAGAEYIDVNCAATAGDELNDVDWIINVIQAEIPDVSLCLDSPNYLAIERGLKAYKGKGGLFINSITAEDARIDVIMPLASQYGTKLIALTMNEKGMPETAGERLAIAEYIVERAHKAGFSAGDLYIDALVRPISTEPVQAVEYLKSIKMIRGLGGGARTVCGLSNVSYGLPHRGLINSIFLAMAMTEGLDAAITDPCEKHIAASLAASNALMAGDEYCAEYIKAFRAGKLI